ncbi:hypothetical protein J6590_055679 [Homalodisca vitripennis]|nr:hypothetical protein J6590_055679 [Homalodisca vitripennis]
MNPEVQDNNTEVKFSKCGVSHEDKYKRNVVGKPRLKGLRYVSYKGKQVAQKVPKNTQDTFLRTLVELVTVKRRRTKPRPNVNEQTQDEENPGMPLDEYPVQNLTPTSIT